MPQQVNDDGTEALLRRVRGMAGAGCARCGQAICGHEAVANIALGFMNAPHCLSCISEILEKPAPLLAPRIEEYLGVRECHRNAWNWATQQEEQSPGSSGCRFQEARVSAGPDEASEVASVSAGAEADQFDSEWDADAMACGDLVLELRGRLGKLSAGAILKLRAVDTGAPHDLPAWCRLTGHRLLRAEHPHYWIKRKE